MSAGRVERVVGGPPLTLTLAGLTIPAELADPDSGLSRGTHGPVTIRRWRSDVDARPEPATCTLTVSAAALVAAGYTGPPRLGDQLVVDLSPAAVAAFAAPPGAERRFTGTITDVDAIAETASAGPARYLLRAAGPAARLGRVVIGEPPWPVELDGDRAARILYAAAALSPDLVVGDLDPGTVDVLAVDIDAQPARGLIDELAASTGGELVELRDGVVEWHDAEHRRNAPPAAELTAGEVLADAGRWSTSLRGLVNDLTLRYGAAGGTGQAEVAVVDQVSVDGPAGRVAASISTNLADAGAATARALDLVGRRSRQRWRLDQLVVDLVKTVTPSKAGQLLALTFGDRLDLAGWPMSGPFATPAVWVEGMTETVTAHAWRLELAVAEYGLSGPARRYVDALDTETIGGVPDDVSILAASAWWPAGAPAGSRGRFVDVPAGLDFRDVPDAELIGSASY